MYQIPKRPNLDNSQACEFHPIDPYELFEPTKDAKARLVKKYQQTKDKFYLYLIRDLIRQNSSITPLF